MEIARIETELGLFDIKDAIARGYHINEYNLINSGLIPNEPLEESNNNIKFMELLAKSNSYLVIDVPRGYTFYIGHIKIARENVMIKGGGELVGTFEIDKFSWERLSGITFKDVTLNGNGNITTNKAVFTLRYVNEPIFENVTFKGAKYGIYIPEYESGGFQHVRKMIIDKCKCDLLGYFIYSEEVDTQYQIGDSYIINSILSCAITHIKLYRVDGITIDNNTLFMPSHESRSTTKEESITITRCNWSHITNNNIFESGYNGIHLTNAVNTEVLGNSIAWCGQRSQENGYGIVLDGTLNQYNIIANNNINTPTGGGIKSVNAKFTSYDNNTIVNPSRDATYYYGVVPFVSESHEPLEGTGNENTLVRNNTSQGGRFTTLGGFVLMNNYDASGINSNIHFRLYDITSTPSATYNTISTTGIVKSATILVTSGWLQKRAICGCSGNREILVSPVDGNTWGGTYAYKIYTIEID